MMEKAGGTSQCIKKFLHISLLSFASSDTFAGRKKRCCQGFPRFTPWAAQTRLPACKANRRQKQENNMPVVTFGSPAPWPAQAHPAEGTSCWEQYYMKQRHSSIMGFSHILAEHPRAANTSYPLQLHVLPVPKPPLRCPPQKYIKSRIQKSFRVWDSAVNRKLHCSFIPNLLWPAAF